jgi:H+/Cl- antiporter ClcA
VAGGLLGGIFVVVVTLGLKKVMDLVSSQVTWILIAVPLLGLVLTVVVLQVFGQRETDTSALPSKLLAVALLRAAATTFAVATGGCGGVFVPFLAVGDLSGRVFAPGLDVGNDLAGAAGAAAGIAGGYRLPLTAMAMVLGLGGPAFAVVTCLATVVIAALAGAGVESVINRLMMAPVAWRRARA